MKMSGSDQEKELGVRLHVRPSLDTISTIPIKKRRFFFSRSPSPPREIQSSPSVNCNASQIISSLEAIDIHTRLTVSSDKDSSIKSGFENSVNGDLNEPKVQYNIDNDCNERLKNGKNGLKDNVFDGKLVSLKGNKQFSAHVGHVDESKDDILDTKKISSETSTAQRHFGNTERQHEETIEKMLIRESLSAKQEHLELQDLSFTKKEALDSLHPQMKCSVSELCTNSAQIDLDRFNWDLNTIMDAGQESCSNSAANHESDWLENPDFVGLLGRGSHSNFTGACGTGINHNESSASSIFDKHKNLDSNHFLSLCSSSKSVDILNNSKTETCLDLHLRPSVSSESYFAYGTLFTSGNVDSFKEKQFLSLSDMPASYSDDPKVSLCRATNTEVVGLESFGLKPIKFEPCELTEAPTVTCFGAANSSSDTAIKLEPVEDESQDCISTKELRLSNLNSDCQNVLRSTEAPLDDINLMTSNIQSDLFINDGIMHMSRKCPHMHKYEVDNIAEVMQYKFLNYDKTEKGNFCQPIGLVMVPSVDEVKELVSIKQVSNEDDGQAYSLVKCQSEEVQIANSASERCEHPCTAAELLQEQLTSGTVVEKIADEKVVVSRTSSSEIESKFETMIVKNVNWDVLEFNQAKKESICTVEEQGGHEGKIDSLHTIDGEVHTVHEKGIDDQGYEDGEVKDGPFRIEKTKEVGACQSGIFDFPVAMPMSVEFAKHSMIESSETSMDPGMIECANNIDPVLATDPQESSSVTGESNQRKTSRATRKMPRDSVKKDKASERKIKFDRDSTTRVVTIENKAEGGGNTENGGRPKSSVLMLGSKGIKDALNRVRTGRIINLNATSSRKIKPIHERLLSSRVVRGKPLDKLFKRENFHSRHSRDESTNEKYHRTEIEKGEGFTDRKHGSGSIHMRVRGGSGSSRSRIRDEQQQNQFGDRNFDHNSMREQINHHNDFRYSRTISLAEASMASGSNAPISCAGRISRKSTNELKTRAHIPYASHEKMKRHVLSDINDPLQARHSQFERIDRFSAHRERLSLSPVRRRGLRLTPPMCSPRTRVMSPSHWSSRSTPEGFNGQPEIIQRRTDAMRSARRCFAEEILARRQGPNYADRLLDGMMEAVSSREEHNFTTSGRDFSRKISRLDINDQRHVPGEYYRAPFARGQIHELAVDSECVAGRRCHEVHVPARYRQHCIIDHNVENFSFHGEESSPMSYRYHAEGNQAFNDGQRSREFEGRFKNRLGNTSRRYRQIEEQHQHEDDGFRHEERQGWNDSSFDNSRSKRTRY